MACLTPEGSLTETARVMLRLLQENAARAEDLARLSGQPLYLTRSTLRQMLEAGLVQEQEGRYLVTDLGKEKL